MLQSKDMHVSRHLQAYLSSLLAEFCWKHLVMLRRLGGQRVQTTIVLQVL